MISNEPRLRSVTCASPRGLHRIGYAEWGEADNPRVLVCVHGLTRTGRDFDTIARAMSATHRVVCPDMAGRGRSDWLADPALYGVPQYLADCVTLIARTGAEGVDWLGTSMGGLIGMALAALPDTPVRRLVINDVGPEVDPRGLARIGQYVGAGPSEFASFDEGLAEIVRVSAEFGEHTDAQWRALNRHYVVERDGRWVFHYDPAIAQGLRAALAAGGMPALWPMWEAIACPTLALRGERSDLLSPATLERMGETGPRARTVEAAGCGHAPTLMIEAQIEPVRRFLAEDDPPVS